MINAGISQANMLQERIQPNLIHIFALIRVSILKAISCDV